MGYVLTLAEAGRFPEADAAAIVARANYPPGTFHECMIPLEALGAAERLDAILRVAQEQVLDGAGHDCEEWRHGLRCGVCGRVLEQPEDQNARALKSLAAMRRAAAAAGVKLEPPR